MKTIFWNTDTQFDFMRKNGKLYVPNAELIEPNLETITAIGADYGIQVINTADWHDYNTEEISDNPDFVNTFPEHCMEETLGAEFVPATTPVYPYVIDWKIDSFNEDIVKYRRNIVLYKDKFDIFEGSPHADPVLKIINPKRIFVYGVATNVCVDDAVMGNVERDREVYVVMDAIKELPNMPLPYDKWEKNGVKMIKTNEIRDYLGGENELHE